MSVRKVKPTSPGRRFVIGRGFEEITTDRPHKPLVEGKRRTGGRNRSSGRIAMRRRGGGHRKLYRIIDFRRDKDGIPARVATIEYDPNRTANIALLHYRDGEKRYILAPAGLRVGTEVVSGPAASPETGTRCGSPGWPGFAPPAGPSPTSTLSASPSAPNRSPVR